MSEATVLTEIAALSNSQSDSAAVADFYPEMVADLAKAGWLSNCTVMQTFAAQQEQTYPDTIVDVLEIFYDQDVLDEMLLRELEEYDPYWRKRTGQPIAWCREEETAKTFAWFPTPDVSSIAVTPVDPAGTGFRPNQAAMLHTETREDVLPYLELPLSLMILEQEYSRESDHQNGQFAMGARALYTAMMAMLQ
jgi:hypothetical protein